MFTLIKNLPDYVVGITMKGTVTKKDFEEVMAPALKEAASYWKGINLLLVQETGLENFTLGAWCKDAVINFSYFFKWNKIAMIIEENSKEKAFGLFDLIIPGEVRMFSRSQYKEAVKWICEI